MHSNIRYFPWTSSCDDTLQACPLEPREEEQVLQQPNCLTVALMRPQHMRMPVQESSFAVALSVEGLLFKYAW